MLKNIREIIHTYFNNDYSERVRKEFARWLKEPVHEEAKDSTIMEIWNGLTVEADQSTEESYKRLESIIQARRSVIQPKSKPFFGRLSRIAAILMLPLISAGITYLLMTPSTSGNEGLNLVECIVPNGEIRTITLPDASVVTINSGSTLIYPRRFSSVRDIYLNGEAYFTVVKDAAKPFIVKTTDMDVEVLGTVFCVSSYTDNESSSATLESGKVNVWFKNSGKEPVTLFPNEQVTYNRTSGLMKKNTVNIRNAIAWTSGNLFIKNLSIDEICKVIERKFNMKVYLNSNKFKDEIVTIRMTNNENISEFMTILNYLIPQMKYKIENDKLFIY